MVILPLQCSAKTLRSLVILVGFYWSDSDFKKRYENPGYYVCSILLSILYIRYSYHIYYCNVLLLYRCSGYILDSREAGMTKCKHWVFYKLLQAWKFGFFIFNGSSRDEPLKYLSNLTPIRDIFLWNNKNWFIIPYRH